MIYASTFLSYSSVDGNIVQLVARELGRRGILPWLDKNELNLETRDDGVEVYRHGGATGPGNKEPNHGYAFPLRSRCGLQMGRG